MSYITTYTGNHFDPINPDPELINIVRYRPCTSDDLPGERPG